MSPRTRRRDQRSGRRASAPQRRARRRQRAARFGRAAAASLVGLVGLAVLVLGPTAVALGWYAQEQIRVAEEANRNPVGTEVSEGPAVFVVHEVRCGTTDDAVHGQSCLVEITARNDGQEALTIPGSAQVLQAPQGVRYLPVGGNAEPFGTLEPGEEATTVLEYDLPMNMLVTHVGVQADAYSRGETISLGGPPLPLLPPTDR